MHTFFSFHDTDAREVADPILHMWIWFELFWGAWQRRHPTLLENLERYRVLGQERPSCRMSSQFCLVFRRRCVFLLGEHGRAKSTKRSHFHQFPLTTSKNGGFSAAILSWCPRASIKCANPSDCMLCVFKERENPNLCLVAAPSPRCVAEKWPFLCEHSSLLSPVRHRSLELLSPGSLQKPVSYFRVGANQAH